MKRNNDLNNLLDNLFSKSSVFRCSYFGIYEPQIDDIIKEFHRCFSYYIENCDISHDIILLFYCILNHITKECLLIDVSKAKQFVEESLIFIRKNVQYFSNPNLENLSFEEIISQKCKYLIKNIELNKKDHDAFISIIRNTESAYLPVFLKQNISIKVINNKWKISENFEMKNLKEAIDNFEKHLENDESNKFVNFSVVTVNGSDDIYCGKVSDMNWNRVAFGLETGMVLVGGLNGKLNTLFGHSMSVTSVNFTSQSDYILSSSLDGTIKIWNEDNNHCIQTYYGHYFPVWEVAANPQIDACFASGGFGGCVCVWDVHRENPVRKMIGHLGSVKTVIFNKSGNYLASGGDDGQIRLWDMRLGNCVRFWEVSSGSKGIEALSFTEGGNKIVFGTDGGFVEWTGIEGTSCVSMHLEEAVTVLLCHLRNVVVAGTINGSIYILDQSGSVSREFDNHFSRIINIQGQLKHGSKVLVLREYE